MSDPNFEVRDSLQGIAKSLKSKVPPGWGFALLVFPFDSRDGYLHYVANGNRSDIIKTMKEFIAKTEGKFGTHQEEIE